MNFLTVESAIGAPEYYNSHFIYLKMESGWRTERYVLNVQFGGFKLSDLQKTYLVPTKDDMVAYRQGMNRDDPRLVKAVLEFPSSLFGTHLVVHEVQFPPGVKARINESDGYETIVFESAGAAGLSYPEMQKALEFLFNKDLHQHWIKMLGFE